MAKGKLQKFAEMETFSNVFQFPLAALLSKNTNKVGNETCPSFSFESLGKHPMAGQWRNRYFHNDNPIVLELGCGKGEYTVGLARRYPEINFIGVDIKGSRMHKGASEAISEHLSNVAFLRTNIEIIDHFFEADEVQQIWLTFSDPQMKNPRKRLTSTYFLNRYKRFLEADGLIHLKTDSNFLFTYTRIVAEHNNLPLLLLTEDLYHDEKIDAATREILSIRTYYESQWIARGLNIRYMKFLLPANAALSEPEVEIEFDEYRSYKRSKRTPKIAGK